MEREVNGFDVFNFLSECFNRTSSAWDAEEEQGTQDAGSHGPIQFQLKYRERPGSPVYDYVLAIDEGAKGPEVINEELRCAGIRKVDLSVSFISKSWARP